MVDKGGHPVLFVIEIGKIVEKEDHGVADQYRMALTELLRKAQMEGDIDFLREGMRVLSQAVMEPELMTALLVAS